jgi:sugar phosphate isomerase/epimerase
MHHPITFSVFTKPWRTMPLPELARFVADCGFDGGELPVRPGFQVEPERIAENLPEAARIFQTHGLRITSVATAPSDAAIATCGELGIPIIRTMAEIGADGYLATIARLRGEYAALAPRLADAGVRLGVQNHYGNYVAHASGLRQLLEGFDPRTIAAIWDPAHNALNGEEPAHAIDIIWPHLCMVNLKNAYWRRVSGPEAEEAVWEAYFTSGPQGRASWRRVAELLQARSYTGVVCLTAEYTDEAAVDRLIAADIAYARSLWATAGGGE